MKIILSLFTLLLAPLATAKTLETDKTSPSIDLIIEKAHFATDQHHQLIQTIKSLKTENDLTRLENALDNMTQSMENVAKEAQKISPISRHQKNEIIAAFQTREYQLFPKESIHTAFSKIPNTLLKKIDPIMNKHMPALMKSQQLMAETTGFNGTVRDQRPKKLQIKLEKPFFAALYTANHLRKDMNAQMVWEFAIFADEMSEKNSYRKLYSQQFEWTKNQPTKNDLQKNLTFDTKSRTVNFSLKGQTYSYELP